MKSKGAIRFFAIALAVVCIFQLSFTVVTHIVENKAKTYANGDKTKYRKYIDSIAHEPVYNLLVRNYTYMEAKERELNLGLDLQGGMHVTLAVSIGDLLKELSDHNKNEAFQEAIKKAQDRQLNSQEGFITLFNEAFREINPDGKLAPLFATRANQDYINFNSSNEEVLRFLRNEANDALDRTFNILRTRIDQFGVTQPNIQKQEGTGRIIVELPGVDDQERVEHLLQGTAKMEFWETFECSEVLSSFEGANKVLKEKLELNNDSLPDSTKTEDEVPFFNEEKSENEKAVIKDSSQAEVKVDTGDTTATAKEGLMESLEGDTGASDTAQQNLTPEEFRKNNPLYAVLTPAIVQTQQGAQARKGPVVGYARIMDTAKVGKYLRMPEVRAELPPDIKFMWTAKPIDEKQSILELVALKVSTRDGEAPLDGEVITDARVDISRTGQREVSINMNSEGARVWADLTGDNIGRSIAISLDGKIYSYPTVNNEITGGRSVIEGNFTIDEAKDLANVLESGKLPLVVKIIEEAVVGPSLGQEAITAGLISLVAGLLIVLIFMWFYYNHGGLVANLALLANLFFIIGILSSLGAALTLPGIAGIVLTIGMSVDANVLIFERIREEIKAGKGLRLAIADGYKNAYSSIIDSNLTTLLTGIILYTFGSGPIHGFAIILIIGILTSLFSAIFITRLVFDWMLSKDRNIKYGNDLTINMFSNMNFNFIKNRKIAYIISGTVLLGGIVSLLTQGLEFGVDFKGGYSYVVRFDKPVKTNEIRLQLAENFNSPPEVKTFGPSNQVKVTTDYLIDSNDKDAEHKVEAALRSGIEGAGYNNYEIMSSQKVGPTIADDIKTSAVWAVIFSLLVIFLYIFIRFRKWQFGLGALMALFHDVLFIISIFSIFRYIMPFSLEADQAFIAAILTIVGYSINDTVVVFDRIRERLSIHKRDPLMPTMNKALNDTLSRTLITSFTTLIVVIILFIFGGEVIRGFSFALLIGITVGTYSSIFIASPIVADFQKDKNKLREI